MENLTGQHIILGITGGIAAYKSAELTRILREKGAKVQVVMTKAAQQFISSLTLQALSGREVRSELFDAQAEAGMGHIELARWADKIVIAPASADCLAKLAHGHADDLLTTLCLASTAPLYIVPAMNQAMWRHVATQQNFQYLQQRGVIFWGPVEGDQACGDVGPGRMLEPHSIVQNLIKNGVERFLEGVRVLITAGPTQESFDPIRYLSNRSSGKMGYALAMAARMAGAEVTLVSGPSSCQPPVDVHCYHVVTAQEMYAAVMSNVQKTDIFISCAAVSDYRPQQTTTKKMTKANDSITVTLVRNPDILAEVAQNEPRPWCVGFAAQTHNVINYAKEKLINKRLDMIIANEVAIADQGFDSDNNAVDVLWHGGRKHLHIGKQNKRTLANELITIIAEQYRKRVVV